MTHADAVDRAYHLFQLDVSHPAWMRTVDLRTWRDKQREADVATLARQNETAVT